MAEENLSERFFSNVKMQALGACIRSKTYLQPGNLCVFPFLESFSPYKNQKRKVLSKRLGASLTQKGSLCLRAFSNTVCLSTDVSTR